MWSLLRKYTLHVFRPLPDLDPDAALAAFEEASACLWDFSVLAELHFEGTPLCTYNLHLLNCRMLAQQSQRGQTSSYGEWWVEQLVQLMKSTLRYRNTTTPELVAVNDLLLRHALARVKVQHPHLKDFDELVPEWGSGAMHGKNLDVRWRGVQLLGSGRRVKEGSRSEAVSALERHLKDFPLENLRFDELDLETLLLYEHCYKEAKGADDEMVILSDSYLRSRSRISKYALVDYEERNGLVWYVCAMKYYIKALKKKRHTGVVENRERREEEEAVAQAEDAIRIGVADLYRAEIVQQEFGHLVKIRKAHPTQTGYGVGIEHLRAKLVYMAKPSAPDAFFATFSMNSRMG